MKNLGFMIIATLAMAIEAASAFAAQTQPKLERVPLLGEAVFTEGIAYSPRRKTFYVTGAVGGSIQEIGPSGKASWFSEAGADGRSKALGTKVDEQRGRLWVAGNDGVYVYDLQSRKLIKKVLTSSAGKFEGSFLNEVELDDEGNAYVTDSMNPTLFKVDARTFAMIAFADMKPSGYGVKNNSPWNLNGVVLTPDKRSLLIGKTNDGTLWRLDLASKKLTQVQTSSPIRFADGLTWGENGTLYIIRNFENKISYIQYDQKAAVQVVRDLDVDSSNFKIPTTAVYVRDPQPYLLVVNAQFEQVPEPFFLTKVPLTKDK